MVMSWSRVLWTTSDHEGQEVADLVAVNSNMIEEVQEDGCREYIEMLKLDKENAELDDLGLIF